jgi:hypothetical protein
MVDMVRLLQGHHHKTKKLDTRASRLACARLPAPGLRHDPIAHETSNDDPPQGDAAGASLGSPRESPGAFEHDRNQLDTYHQGTPMPGPSAFDEGSKAPQPARWEGPGSPPHQFRDEYDSLESNLGDPPGAWLGD